MAVTVVRVVQEPPRHGVSSSTTATTTTTMTLQPKDNNSNSTCATTRMESTRSTYCPNDNQNHQDGSNSNNNNNNKSNESSFVAKNNHPTLTARDVGYALTVYLLVPLLFLALTSAYHEHLDWLQQQHQQQQQQQPKLHHDIHPSTVLLDRQQQLLDSHLLVLGFSSSANLWHVLYDRLLSVSVWGLLFVVVRKGWNPAIARRHHHHAAQGVVQRYWKGTALSTLAVFHATFARILVQRFLKKKMTWLFGDVTTHNDNAHHHHHLAIIIHSLLVGLTWAMANAWIRRRLDPALRPHLMTMQTWRDLYYGGCSFAASAYLKSVLGPVVEPPVVTWWQQHVPLDTTAAAVTRAWSVVFGKSAAQFWPTLVHAIFVGIAYSVTFLGIRKFANPDSRSGCVRRHGADACFGGLALTVGVYLRLALVHWLPILVLFVQGLLFDHSTWTRIFPGVGGDGKDGEL